jgi:hypothetical protein
VRRVRTSPRGDPLPFGVWRYASAWRDIGLDEQRSRHMSPLAAEAQQARAQAHRRGDTVSPRSHFGAGRVSPMDSE